MATVLDTETADYDLTSLVTVLTHTPSTTQALKCMVAIKFGVGGKNLDGAGGYFQMVITIGGRTFQPSPMIIEFGTEAQSFIASQDFVVPANEVVLVQILSPNAGDSDVGVTTELYNTSSGIAGEDIDSTGGETVTMAKALEVILAAIIGQTIVSTVDSDTKRMQFLGRDDATVIAQVDVSTTTAGSREDSLIDP